MSEVPKEFEWIKPGVKCSVNEISIIINGTPYYWDREECWVVDYRLYDKIYIYSEHYPSESFPVACECLSKVELVPLILTRDEAEFILNTLSNDPFNSVSEKIQAKLSR